MPAPARGLPQSQPRPSPPTKFVQSSRYPLSTMRRGPRVAAPQRLLDGTEIGGFRRSILLTCRAGRFSWTDSRCRSRTDTNRDYPSIFLVTNSPIAHAGRSGILGSEMPSTTRAMLTFAEPAGQETLAALARKPVNSGLVVGPDGFEPSTSPLSGVRSNRAELWAPRGSHLIRPRSPSRKSAGPVLRAGARSPYLKSAICTCGLSRSSK